MVMKPRFARILGWSLFLLLSAGACAPPVQAPKPQQPTQAAKAPDAKPAPAKPVPELIEVRILVVSYDGAAGAPAGVARTKQDAEARARMIARMARSGDKLAELVRKYSDRPGASEDLGLFRLRPSQPGAFGEAVAKAAVALDYTQISEPIDAPEGYFVIERRPDPPTGPARVGAKHILISFAGAEHAIAGVTRTEAEARALAEAIDRRAKAGEDWMELAKNTDEPGSKETGGDLGKFGRGQMVKSFEVVAFALAVGQISDVVKSPFGFHIIQRYD
jgi:peptidyl-prolyl cis-trans isomerase NIMA-interacting 1